MSKLKVVLDGATRDEVDCPAARNMATKVASQQGFGGGGMCQNPVIGPVGADGEMLDGLAAMQPGTAVAGYRAEFMFANKI